MSRKSRSTLMLVALLLQPQFVSAGLQIGDKAPPLDKVQWLKGEPVDLVKGQGKEVYVLEFWAVWCGPCIMQIPHITELQKKFGPQGVRFVGITGSDPRQRLADVKKFVADKGDKMGYTVGFDPTEQSYSSYMAASGVNSIPHVFIVGKDARIAWHGDPGDEMEEILKLILEGKFDADKAKERAEQRKKLDDLAVKFNMTTRTRDWERGLVTLNEMLNVDSANREGIQLSLQILSQEMKDPQRLRSWVDTYLQKHQADAEGLALVATTLLEFPQLGDRQPDLALLAAEAASAADPGSMAAIQAHARALHQIGQIEQAVEVQTRAVASANGSDKADAERVLEFYRACQRLAKR